MKCSGRILNPRSLDHRADHSRDLRCHNGGHVPIRGRWFCHVHAPLWRTHYEILDRIRAL